MSDYHHHGHEYYSRHLHATGDSENVHPALWLEQARDNFLEVDGRTLKTADLATGHNDSHDGRNDHHETTGFGSQAAPAEECYTDFAVHWDSTVPEDLAEGDNFLVDMEVSKHSHYTTAIS